MLYFYCKYFIINNSGQSTSQQDQQQLVDIILANVGTVICFRSGNPADERLVLPLFAPYIDSGEISNLPAYNFYMRISAVQAQEPMSGETVLLENEGSEQIANKVIASSRKHYAIEYVAPKLKPAVTASETKKQTEKEPTVMKNVIKRHARNKSRAKISHK